MRTQLLSEEGSRIYAIVLDAGEEAVARLREVALDLNLAAASVTAIGGFERTVLGFFDLAKRDYLQIELGEQAEVLSLIGDFSCAPDGGHTVHAHVTVGTRDGAAHGGHLLEGVVRPTLEVVVYEMPAHLQRRKDPATGLALLDLGESR